MADKPKTNGDRIRGMSDEELANWLTDDPQEQICVEACGAPKYCEGMCYPRALDWLRREANWND